MAELVTYTVDDRVGIGEPVPLEGLPQDLRRPSRSHQRNYPRSDGRITGRAALPG